MWTIGDIFVATMAVINSTAIVLLFGQARAAILDWDAQCRARHHPRFFENTLPRPVPGAVWSEKD
ncbi:alanine:cation symporter family protein [Nocardia goodfellowii]